MKPMATYPAESDELEAAAAALVTAQYSLRLFVTASASNSSRAIANIRAICEQYLAGRYDLEIVNVAQHPEAASANQIIATPTLVKILPLPSRRFIGDMSQTDRILSGLGIHSAPLIIAQTTNS